MRGWLYRLEQSVRRTEAKRKSLKNGIFDFHTYIHYRTLKEKNLHLILFSKHTYLRSCD
ncbi:hypothetical protein [Trichormus azollae]|uniref:hypothetical protein n=1 Tax=Trichormus azollae TaxID=1164 RepID=UPI0016519323|nr:hypothetical protein [Trichormus azollae]